MTYKLIKLATVGLAGLAVSGCTLPDYLDGGDEVKLQAPSAPVVAAPAVKAPTAVAPKKPRWVHQPSGNTEEMSDSDEDGGWS